MHWTSRLTLRLIRFAQGPARRDRYASDRAAMRALADSARRARTPSDPIYQRHLAAEITKVAEEFPEYADRLTDASVALRFIAKGVENESLDADTVTEAHPASSRPVPPDSVRKVAAAEPGDLVFLSGNLLGVYIGDDRMARAGTEGALVVTDDVPAVAEFYRAN